MLLGVETIEIHPEKLQGSLFLLGVVNFPCFKIRCKVSVCYWTVVWCTFNMLYWEVVVELPRETCGKDHWGIIFRSWDYSRVYQARGCRSFSSFGKIQWTIKMGNFKEATWWYTNIWWCNTSWFSLLFWDQSQQFNDLNNTDLSLVLALCNTFYCMSNFGFF